MGKGKFAAFYPDIYNIAKQAYDGDIESGDGIERCIKEFGMKKQTADDFIRTYRKLRKGECLKDSIDTDAIEYYLEKIYEYEGFTGLRVALDAVYDGIKHIEKRDDKEQHKRRKLHQKFRGILENESKNIFQDIENITSNPELNYTEKEQLIKARVGQGKYRDDLIDHWGCCSVTGYSGRSMLVASHIKPWRYSTDKERLDKYNGLLLIPNLDKAFDKGLISFGLDGRVIISSEFNEFEKFGINVDMSVKLSEGHKSYMQYHRERVLKKN